MNWASGTRPQFDVLQVRAGGNRCGCCQLHYSCQLGPIKHAINGLLSTINERLGLPRIP